MPVFAIVMLFIQTDCAAS